MVVSVNKDNFENEVLNSTKPVLIDFYADWCGPCKMSAPALEELSEELSDKLKVVKVNVDSSPELAVKFGIMSIPVFVCLKGGKEIKRVGGLQTVDSLKEFLSGIL